MIFHFHFFGGDLAASLWERIYRHASGFGSAGVDLFFVLSGYLITGILFETRDRPTYYRTFYARRTLRIFPLYYASLAVFYGLGPLLMQWAQHQASIGEVIRPASQHYAWTYLLNWPIGLYGWRFAPELLQHFWTLSIEEQFYLAWPLIVRTFNRRRLMVVCAALTLFSLAARLVLHNLDMDSAAHRWTFCRMDSLAIGAFVALCQRDEQGWLRLQRITTQVSVIASIGLALVAAFPHSAFSLSTIDITLRGLLFGGVLAILIDAPATSLAHKSASAPILRFFGKYSYCLYVVHQPVSLVLRKGGVTFDRLTGMLHNQALAIVAVNTAAFAISIALAYLSWHAFEKHFLKLKPA